MSHVVNMRTPSPRWINGDDQLQQWEREAQRIREDMATRGVRYQVSPGQCIRTASGVALREGTAITVEHFQGFVDQDRQPVAAWRLLRDAVQECRVLESDFVEPTPPRAA